MDFTPHTVRQPAAIVLTALASGILLDRILYINESWLPTWFWYSAFCLLMLLLVCVCKLSSRPNTTVVLWLLCLAAGGWLHHQHWFIRFNNDIARYAKSEMQIVEVEGVLIRQPRVRYPQSNPAMTAMTIEERTESVIECTSLIADSGRIKVSGKAWLIVTGIMDHVQVGDTVHTTGLMGLPSGRVNPGGFDFRHHLQRQRCLCMIVIKHPSAVQVVQRNVTAAPWRWLSRWKQQTEAQLNASLSPTSAELAAALLLGSRTNLQESTRQMFAQSGAMHLLAISGVHVGILAAFIWYATSFCFLPNRFRILAVLVAMLFYCTVTEHRPSVVRASLFIGLGILAQAVYRQAFSINTLAVTAIGILLVDPTQLFDVGAQLSFSATYGVLLALNIETQFSKHFSERIHLNPGKLMTIRNWLFSWLKTTCLITLAIWILTAPLVAARFHLVAPVGYVLNLVLLPLLIPIMWVGFTYLILSWIVPVIIPFLQPIMETLLRILSFVVHFSGNLHWGHFYVPDIPQWWLNIYYVLLFFCCTSIHNGWYPTAKTDTHISSSQYSGYGLNRRLFEHNWIRMSCYGFLCWVLIGLCLGLWPAHYPGLRCTILSVGHGSAILLKLPNGKSILYDAGSLNNDIYASRVIQSALWRHGKSQLDCAIISHADIDHFNALPHLLQRIPVQCLLMTRHFLSHEEPSVVALCQSVEQRNIPVRMVHQGCSLLADSNVQIQILHPDEYEKTGTAENEQQRHSDNQFSIVLQVQYAGRTLLLTGDVEGEALDQLQQQPLDKIDLLLAPHHGSLSANTRQLLDWTRADYIVASCSRRDQQDKLQQIFSNHARVYTTARYGAVTATISATGEMDVQPYLSP